MFILLINKPIIFFFQVQFINCDNAANLKRALLDMAKMEMTVEQQPLIIVDENEDLEDDWTKVAESHPFDLNAMDITEVDFAPCPVSPQDEFYPIGLEEEQMWDSGEGDYSNIVEVIQMLEDKVANLKSNPRINNIQRLSCICHTLQVKKHFHFFI